MIELLVVVHVIGPALFFYSLAYLLVHPNEWTGAALIGSLGLLLTFVSQALGLRALRQCHETIQRTILMATQIGGLVGGVAIGIMIYFLIRK